MGEVARDDDERAVAAAFLEGTQFHALVLWNAGADCTRAGFAAGSA
jgi:hypothetical protein